MNRRFLILPVFASAAALSSANFVTNGNFSDYTGSAFTGSRMLGSGNTDLTGWTVGQSGINVVDSSVFSISAPYAIDLEGTTGNGSISQTLNLPQDWYEVSFWARTSLHNDPTELKVSLGGSNGIWTISNTLQRYQMWLPSSGIKTLTFETLEKNNANGGFYIDNIAVTALPEPSTMAALGLGALAFLKRRRK